MYTVFGRTCPLVELSGQKLHGNVWTPFEVEFGRDPVGNNLSKDGVEAFIQEFLAKTKQIVYVYQSQAAYIQTEICIQFVLQTDGFYPETLFFFYKNTIIHINTLRLFLFKKTAYKDTKYLLNLRRTIVQKSTSNEAYPVCALLQYETIDIRTEKAFYSHPSFGLNHSGILKRAEGL